MDIDVTINHDPYSYETLIRSIYTSPDTACIREIVRNALDAHIDAGIPDTKVDVNFSENFFYVRDYGLGITPEKLKSLMSVLMKSDKRDKHAGDETTQTGQHGLGSKTPFGILYEAKKKGTSCVVFMTSIVGDQKWVYELIIKDDGMPTYSLLRNETTDEPSGVEYMIQLTKSMRDISCYKFLEIFAPIHNKINFIGYDFSQHLMTVDLGKYKIHFVKKFNHEKFNVDTSLTDVTTCRQLLNDVSDRMMVKYEGLLYPSPIHIDAKPIEHCAHRIQYFYEHPEFCLAPRYIIEYDIGNHSYGMETTRSRDGFIIENSDVDGLRDDMYNNMPNVSHVDYIKCVVISGLHEYREYIENKDVECTELEFDNDLLYTTVKFDQVLTILQTLIMKDQEFIDYTRKNGIKNRLMFEKHCINRRTFTVEELLCCLKYQKGFSNDKVTTTYYESVYQTYTLLFNEYYNIEPTYMTLDPLYEIASDVPLEKAVFSAPYSMWQITKNTSVIPINSNRLVVSDVYKIKDDELVTSSIIISDNDDVYNYFTILYKNSKINKRKLEAYVRQQGKPVVVMESSKTMLNNSSTTLLQKDRFSKYKSAITEILFCHHMKNPVLFSSDVMPKVKAIKKEEPVNANPFKVKDLDTKSRGISIYNQGTFIDDCTYQHVMDLYNSFDTIHVMYDSNISKTRSYYNAYDVYYDFEGISKFGFMRVRIESKDFRFNSHKLKNFNADHIMSEQNVIIFNGKPSKALYEFINNNPKTVDANKLFETFIDEIEENKFKSFKGMPIFADNEPLSIDETINHVSLLIAAKTMNKRFMNYDMRAMNSFSGNIRRMLMPLKYMIDKHIFGNEERLMDIERLEMSAFNSILHTYSDEDIKYILKEIEEIDNKIVDIIQSYSKIELDFVKMTIEASDKSHVNDYSLVKQYEQAFKF